MPGNAVPAPDRARAGSEDSAWALLLLAALMTLVLQIGMPFRLDPRGLATPLAFIVLLGGLAAFYRHRRPDERIAAMLAGLQQMALFSAIGVVLSYMVAARGGALWDTRFAAWDGALGLDWMGWIAWLDAHPLAAMPLGFAYRTLMPQMAALIVLLGLTGRLRALRITILGAMIAGLATILISGLMPAVAVYAHFGIAPADYPNLRPAAALVHMADVTALRDGTLRLLAVDRLEGIITFPSYHGALAVVFGWGFSQVPVAWLRRPGMALAAMTLIATPVDGGHYFVDVAAGALIAATGLWIARPMVDMRLARHRRRTAAQAG